MKVVYKDIVSLCLMGDGRRNPVHTTCWSDEIERLQRLHAKTRKCLTNKMPILAFSRDAVASFISIVRFAYFKRKTKCKADRTAQRVILMPNSSVSHY